MTSQELREALALGREQPSVEFKGPGLRSDKAFFARVARAVLGMSNRRDGGVVVIGVEDDKGAGLLNPLGMTAEQLRSWRYDNVADGLAAYADPSVAFSVADLALDGKDFLAIIVSEFTEVPVLCRKTYNDTRGVILREGACYVRPRRKPETVEVGTSADFRDLIELATEKRVRSFTSLVRVAGLSIGPPEPSDRERFEAELDDLK